MPSKSLKTLPKPAKAFLTDSPVEILKFLLQSLEEGQICALIMLVEVIGGGSRAPGAMMAVRKDGQYCGFVSGGCIEAAAAQEALEALEEGKDRFCFFGKNAPFFDLVLPCGGTLKLAIHLVKKSQPFKEILGFLEKREEAFLRYHPATETVEAVKGTLKTGWQKDFFCIAFPPIIRLFLSGGRYETKVLAKMAAVAGLEICLNPDLRTADRQTAIALLYHDPETELAFLEQALQSNAFYLGCLGSHTTHEKRKHLLRQNGFSDLEIEKISAPIGLFGPVRNVRTLAVSILAEVMKKAGNVF